MFDVFDVFVRRAFDELDALDVFNVYDVFDVLDVLNVYDVFDVFDVFDGPLGPVPTVKRLTGPTTRLSVALFNNRAASNNNARCKRAPTPCEMTPTNPSRWYHLTDFHWFYLYIFDVFVGADAMRD